LISVKSKRTFVIPFVGLKLGFHEFDFEIHDAFFEEKEYSIIHSGNVNVHLVLEKKETMMIAEFELTGNVSTSCDRCDDPIEVPVKGQFRLVYKFGLEQSEDEALIVLHPDAYELDVNENIYELITVSMPARSVHKQGECNEEMLSLISQYTVHQAPSEDDFDDEDDDWDDDDDDWDDEDSDDDDSDDDDWDDDEKNSDDSDGPIDPRWNALKNLNNN
jgi:uncharacterized protein